MARLISLLKVVEKPVSRGVAYGLLVPGVLIAMHLAIYWRLSSLDGCTAQGVAEWLRWAMVLGWFLLTPLVLICGAWGMGYCWLRPAPWSWRIFMTAGFVVGMGIGVMYSLPMLAMLLMGAINPG